MRHIAKLPQMVLQKKSPRHNVVFFFLELKSSAPNEFKNPEILRPLIKPSPFPTPDKKFPFYNKSSAHSSPSTGAFSDNALSSLIAKLDHYLETHRVLPMDIEHGLKERIAEIKVKREVQKLNELMKRHMSNMPIEIAQHHWRCFTSIKGSQMRIEQIEETLVSHAFFILVLHLPQMHLLL